MPKAAKDHTLQHHRTLPYPVSTTSSMGRPPPSPPAAGEYHSTSAGSWTRESDELLMRARQQGLNWQPIACTYFPNKTANACRKRHERLMVQRNKDGSWEGVKMETLAKAYNDVRKHIWQILADRVGENWQTVEAKCMEKGLKTLQSTGRTAARRERTHLTDDFPDHLSNDHSPIRSRSRSQDNISDGFNDSAIGPDNEAPFVSRGQDNPHHQPPHSAGSRFSTPIRTFSTSSTSLSSLTPTVTASPQFSILHSPSMPQSQQQQQTLPSFSAAFGMQSLVSETMPSISSMMRSPRSSPDTKH